MMGYRVSLMPVLLKYFHVGYQLVKDQDSCRSFSPENISRSQSHILSADMWRIIGDGK